jgi:hypothetical protein
MEAAHVWAWSFSSSPIWNPAEEETTFNQTITKGGIMKNKAILAGLWVDHQEAFLVTLTESGEQIQHIESGVQKQERRLGRPPGETTPVSIASGEVPPDDVREREYKDHLARYYDKILPHLQSAAEVLILGPGEAKMELKKRLTHIRAGAPRLALQAADKMTLPQIVAQVRHYFHQEAPRGRGVQGAILKPSTQVHYA